MSTRKRHTLAKRKKQVFLEKIFICFFAFFVVVCLGIGSGNNCAEAREKDKLYKSIELEPGDTLWDIAKQYADADESVCDYINELKEINGLDSDEIHEGHYLTVVYYGHAYDDVED